MKKTSEPERFGVATINKDGKVSNIEEKPEKSKSDLAVTGVYIYDNSVFKKMTGQKPSKRGEYEITFVNNKYTEEGNLKYIILEKEWFDIGTFDSLLRASNYMKEKEMKERKLKK